MRFRSAILLLLATIGAAFALGADPAPAGRPVYPLYAPFFGPSHRFTPEDLRILGGNFEFLYGQAMSPADMAAAHQLVPGLKLLAYTGNWAVRADEAEKKLRDRILYYLAAETATAIDAQAGEFLLRQPTDSRALLLLPSNTPGDFSIDGSHYVTWLRVGDEYMKVEGWNPATRLVRVSRGFAGSSAAAHPAGTPVLHPAYSAVPGSGRGRISYLYDPAYPERWTGILERLENFSADGGDGVWIDILMASTLGDSDVGGTRLRGVNAESAPGDLFVWDFREQRPYRRDEFRRRTEQQVRMIQDTFRARHGRPALIYGNNMFYTEYTDGGGATWHYMAPTPDKPEPVAGMCIEDYMGGYDAALWEDYTRRGVVVPPPKASLGTHTYRNWRLNQGMLADCAQRGLPAVPLTLNAGMKTVIFEHLDRATRHEWERWAYASYLLCVELRDGRSVTMLGVPLFYFDNGVRHADIDPLYRWPIGAPAQTIAAEKFDDYRLPGSPVYARRFSNGLVLVNPTGLAAEVALPEPLIDPDTAQRVTRLSLPPQTGFVLLRDFAPTVSVTTNHP